MKRKEARTKEELNKLMPFCRTLTDTYVVDCLMEGMTYEETAQRIGVTRQAIDSRLKCIRAEKRKASREKGNIILPQSLRIKLRGGSEHS
jgi:DNA-directed RNA polymerase specialized sigma24 family protein